MNTLEIQLAASVAAINTKRGMTHDENRADLQGAGLSRAEAELVTAAVEKLHEPKPAALVAHDVSVGARITTADGMSGTVIAVVDPYMVTAQLDNGDKMPLSTDEFSPACKRPSARRGRSVD